MAKKRSVRASSKIVPSSSKIHVALKNLVVFAILFGLSLGIYHTSKSILWMNTFGILSLITGFIALAFVVVYLILIFMKWFKK